MSKLRPLTQKIPKRFPLHPYKSGSGLLDFFLDVAEQFPYKGNHGEVVVSAIKPIMMLQRLRVDLNPPRPSRQGNDLSSAIGRPGERYFQSVIDCRQDGKPQTPGLARPKQ